jgi:RHS repeat-associated protein
MQFAHLNTSKSSIFGSTYRTFGMQLPERHESVGDSYRYGFQNQEVDAEVKGEGNSVNYKYRMHDPRLGRFFAVDPLAGIYPHNSPYAFSENSTIAFTELEGLEKYFAADGSYVGSVGNDPEIRVFNSAFTVKEAMEYVQSISNKVYISQQAAKYMYSESILTELSKLNGQSQERMSYENFGRIFDYMFEDVSSLDNLSSGKIGLVDGTGRKFRVQTTAEEDVSMSLQSFEGITFANSKKIFYQIGNLSTSNYYDIATTLYHESLHLTDKSNYPSGSFGEFNAHYMSTQHDYYKNTSEGFKNENLSSMKDYLQKQIETENQSSSTKKLIKENINKYQTEFKKINGKEDESISY